MNATERQTVYHYTKKESARGETKRGSNATDVFPLEAIDEDVEIGLVLSAQGENLPLDEAFPRIRMSIRGEQAACDTEKEEPGEEMTIWVDKIYYTQKSCGPRFLGGPYAGRPLEEAIADLESGIIDQLRDEWLVLDVVKRGNRLQSVDNRRLYCLKMWQQRHPSNKKVLARIRMKVWDTLFGRYMSHSESPNGGETIRKRQSSYFEAGCDNTLPERCRLY